MATPRRRSSRLAGGATPARHTASKLSSLVERDETPRNDSSLGAMMSPPQTRNTMPGAFVTDVTPVKTPETSGRLRPSHQEMHPSKVQQSTTKAPDSGLRLGFVDINQKEEAAARTIDHTPSKSRMPMSPRFDFKWARPDSDLSSEAQRIMDSVRQEAAKIKEKMKLERDEQARKDVEAEGITGRKIAKPKSRRFSDAHKAEFRKMDSIANHVSLWKSKAQPSSSSNTNLKRSKSRADLNGDYTSQEDRPGSSHEPAGKRVKTSVAADVSTARPQSSHSSIPMLKQPSTPSRSHITKHTQTTPLPSVVTTPTKASLARANSVKSLRATKLPTLNRSKTTANLRSPAPPKTEGNKKYFSALARAPSMKSILHRSQPKFSDDPSKIAAGTHLPAPKKDMAPIAANSGPTTISHPGTLLSTPSAKRVDFKLDIAAAAEDNANSPSPSKIARRATGIPSSPSKANMEVTYPSLKLPNDGPLSSNPTQPGDFTFRSATSIKFGRTSPRPQQPSIRQVRPSGVTTPLSAFESLPSIPHGVPNKKRRHVGDDEEDAENVPPSNNTTEGSLAKRQKTQNTTLSSPRKMDTPKKRPTLSKTPTSKAKKGGLSLARLNMLARPKERR